MTEPRRNPSSRSGLAALTLAATCLVAISLTFLSGCLFDKPDEEVTLKLNKVPAGTDRVRVLAVDATDTAKVFARVYDGGYSAGRALKFSLGGAAGKAWMLKAEGYQAGYRVYLSLIPSGKDGNGTEALHIPVGRGLPGVEVVSAAPDTAGNILFTTAFRNPPVGVHWHINMGVDYVIGYDPALSVAASRIKAGTLLTFDLHTLPTHDLFPVQEADTMLADEALTPAKAGVTITEAFSKADSVHVFVSTANFKVPNVDEPRPGQGFPLVLEGGTFRTLTDFRAVQGEPNHLVAPTWALDKVENLVVALHYANLMRIRPLAADTIPAALALRSKEVQPELDITSHAITGDTLWLSYDLKNAAGHHVHVYRDKIEWPGATDYVACHEVPCPIHGALWKGAARLVISVQRDGTHALIRPVASDTLHGPL